MFTFMRLKDLNRFGLEGLRRGYNGNTILTALIKVFKQYLISPTSRPTSHVGRLNLSTLSRFKIFQRQGYERLKPSEIQASITMKYLKE